jgi:Wzt C-terminal domain
MKSEVFTEINDQNDGGESQAELSQHLIPMEAVEWRRRFFSGRVFFDHMAKTAGQAVNAWLRKALGVGTVTDNMIGSHRELINSYGGQFSIISAHIFFQNGEGLDPRWRYATIIREPLDRVLSWLYFVINNHAEADLPELHVASLRFLESDGDAVSDAIAPQISNYCVEHFCRILGSGLEDDETRLENALRAIELYDVVGLHHKLPEFLQDMAALIGLAAPAALGAVNVTTKRPGVAAVSEAMRKRIVALNSLDIRFFEKVCTMVAARQVRVDRVMAPQASLWDPYDGAERRILATPDLMVERLHLQNGTHVEHGSVMNFVVDFELHRTVECLEAGIHIFRPNGEWAFGVNSTLLNQELRDMQPGRYRLIHHVIAELPAGDFTAGIAFADRSGPLPHELYWHDSLCNFSVAPPVGIPGVGLSRCRARITISPGRNTC